MNRLDEIIQKHEDGRTVAEYAGVTLTLEDYDYIVQQANQSQSYKQVLEGLLNLRHLDELFKEQIRDTLMRNR